MTTRRSLTLLAAVVAVLATGCPPPDPAADVTPPVFGAPSGTDVVTSNPMGAIVPYTVGATDAVDGVVDVSCTPAANTLVAVGTTPVTCTATDDSANVASTSFLLSVLDDEEWLAPGCYPNDSNVDVEYIGPEDTVDNVEVHYASFDGTCSGASAARTLVRADDRTAADIVCQSLTTTDAAFQPAQFGYAFPADAWACRLPFAGTDTTPPSLTLPASFIVASAGPSGAFATFGVDSYDNEGPTTTDCTPASGDEFPNGTNTVTCTATDVALNTTTDTFTIDVTSSPLYGAAGCYGSSSGNNDFRYNGYQDTAGNLRAYFNADDGTCTGALSVPFTMVKAVDTSAATLVCQGLAQPGGNVNLVASGWTGFPSDAWLCFT